MFTFWKKTASAAVFGSPINMYKKGGLTSDSPPFFFSYMIIIMIIINVKNFMN